MNFNQMMNWILGRSQPSQLSPVPEKTAPQAERRISHRLSNSEGIVQIAGVGEFPVKDLSQGGLSVDTHSLQDSSGFQVGNVLSARLLLGNVFFETDLRICSIRKDEAGCSFNSMPFGHSRVLHDFIKPTLLGKSLREIKSTEANLLWFQGDEETQIHYWRRPEGGLDKADFYFMGYVISFDGKDNSLKTGFVQSPFLGSSVHRVPGEGAIVYHEVPSYRALKLGHIIFDQGSLPEEVYVNLGCIMFREEKCTFSRVILGENEKNIRFEFADESGKVVLKVASLCSTAISALLPDSPVKRKVPGGTLLNGVLHLPELSLPATFKVVFQHDFFIGGGLKLHNPDDAEVFASFLTPRLLGKSLESVAPPVESKPFAPYGSRASLHVGIHNTHLLSLLSNNGQLLYGRLVFSDRVVIWDKNSLSAYSCVQGLIFPSDWETVINQQDQISHDDPALMNTTREILHSSRISQDVLKAWLAVLPRPEADLD
ncbi:MAG: hypothetical protein GQF41_3394 [Candidatus Rifleibacterium amylolyticum]|nr:MAG: hypothetical protein GQF41_3394 [Candidatus Rifleibacterium amylolyticum]